MILNNKISIITGGATGIGKATVETFAKEGAKVIFCDTNKKQGLLNQKNLIIWVWILFLYKRMLVMKLM